MANATIMAIATDTGIYDVRLSADRNPLMGPLGTPPPGLFHSCGRVVQSGSFTLSACVKLLGLRELYAFGIFLIMSGFLIGSAFLFIRANTRWLIAKLSKTLKHLSDTDTYNADPEFLNVQEVIELKNAIDTATKEVEKQRVNSALTNIALRLAHDIRSPLDSLRTVFANIQLVDGEQKKLLGLIVMRIENICTSLLGEFRKGRTQDSVARTDLRLLISEIVVEKRQEFVHRPSITISDNLDKVSQAVQLDRLPGQDLKRVLSNLINNAADAVGSDGRILVILEQDGSNHVIIKIIDNGKGMPEAILSQVFEPGFTHGKENGTGIGLSSSREFVERHKGTITAESKVGIGTTITLRFLLDGSQA